MRPRRAPLRACFILIVLCDVWLVGDAAGSSKRNKSPLVLYMLDGSACNQGANAVSWSKVWFSPKGSSRLCNADFGLSRPAKSLRRIAFKIVRCSDSTISYNTCEYFDTWKFEVSPCTLMRASKMPWTPWVTSITPSIYCPIKAGNYSFRDAGVSPEALAQFGIPLDNVIWIVTLTLFDNDAREYACVNYTLEFKRSRQ
ncbi:uncharacterized protein LOC113214781 [Frankliniella occidentalis]|uniref:Uncharacterized protein LOC113214781 n=1 Tax=Frankliniella occidentalis TaxID=133901 RepID=A0A6J1TB47_FRAOC|nr:uncharacterized protein LOC113214781 [Frankliniella occidentalis]